MPEILEIEMYRRGAAALVGRTISEVHAPDAWFLKGTDAAAITAPLLQATVTGLGRVGKLMLLETDQLVVGLRFGMTGRLVIDGDPVIAELEYSSKRLDPDWERFRLGFEAGGTMAMNDPRRLGGVMADPDLTRLGPDVWSLEAGQLRGLLSSTKRACKALLLDQQRVAGLGNLLVDELCWRAGVHPATPGDELTAAQLSALVTGVGPMLDELFERGGSHLGDHVEARQVDSRCPRDGELMQHATIGGRSTWWCPAHQHRGGASESRR